MKNGCLMSGKSALLPIPLFCLLLLWVMSCEREADFRTPAYADFLGNWNASGLAFELGGPMPTRAQLDNFKNLGGVSYTFNNDKTYVKRTLDSIASTNTVQVKLEQGTYKLSGDQLILTTHDTLSNTSRNTYYTCYFAVRNLAPTVTNSMIIRTTKDLLLKGLNEPGQTDTLSNQKRDFLNAQSLFIVSQTLQR